MNYTVKEIAEITGGELSGSGDRVIRYLSLDSRTLHSPGSTLFVAIRGERHDGHRFVPELVRRGIKACLVQELPDAHVDGPCSFILVPDTLKALQDLASHHRRGNDALMIGITGSNGKTIVKEWIYQALSPDKKVIRSPKSYNSQVGVPLSVLLLEDQAEVGLFEAGISRPGEMEKLQTIIQPSIGIFTNIGEAHQEGFENREAKIRQKLLLFSDADKLIYCMDQKEVDKIIREDFAPGRLFTWSEGEDSDVRLVSKKVSGMEMSLGLEYEGESFEINFPFLDSASLENAMHVVSLLLYMGYSPLVLGARISELGPVAMRMEMVTGSRNCTIINDSYNSDLVSLSIALDYLRQQKQHEKNTLILSDIHQSGKDEESLYSEVAAMLKSKKIKRLIGIGPALVKMQKLFPGGSSFFQNTEAFLNLLHTFDFHNEAILIKGARSFAFEKITSRLQKKSHETILEIDLNAMTHNLNVYRSMLTHSTKIMVMVKAFSYGSGSFEIANALQYQKVDYLCVAYADEGIALRNTGVHLPILVMNPEITGFDHVIENHLEPEIYNFRSLFSFLAVLEKNNVVSYPVHLKLETGMNRLGFREGETDQLIEVLKQNESLRIQSIFTHLGASDNKEHDAYSREQIDRFEGMSSRIMESTDEPVLRHVLNTSGIERFPEASYDMVRLGIGLYGISEQIGDKLLPVSTLRSTLSQVKPVRKGESLGYNRNVIASGDMIAGIVPVGYADGLRRDMGYRNVSFVVNGHPAPVLGNLCMDMCILDLTGISAQEGDEVIVFGKEQPVSRLAEQLDTIPYEILAGLSERIKRIYYQE